MTRIRLPADWSTLSRREQRRALDTMARLAGHPALEDVPDVAVSAPREMGEQAEQRALFREARRHWWGQGLRSHVQERHGLAAGRQAKAAGQSPGWPDVTLVIPRHGKVGEHRGLLAAVELKSPKVGPRRGGQLAVDALDEGWWLEWAANPPDGWELARSEPKRYGLTVTQARTLRDLRGASYRVRVCWTGGDAWAWLNTLAGTRPRVLPEGWA